MNGIPHIAALRSISLYGLSDVIMTFRRRHRQLFRPPAGQQQHAGHRPAHQRHALGLAMSSPSGLIYRYVLQTPDRSPMELKTFETWVSSRLYARCPAWRTIPASAAATCNIRCCSTRQDRRRRPVGVAGGNLAGRQQFQCRRRLLLPGRPVLLRHRGGPHGDAEDIGNVVVAVKQRHARAAQGCRPGGDRHRAAPGRIRL